MISYLDSGTLLLELFYTLLSQTLYLLTILFLGHGWGAEGWSTFLNRALSWDPGTLHTTIAGCRSIIAAIWSLGFSCLLLNYVVMNFPLAWLIFKDNIRNSNLMLISIPTVMVFPWVLCASYYSILILKFPGGMIFIYLMSGSERMWNVNSW